MMMMQDASGAIIPAGLDPSKVCGCQVPTVDLCHDVNCGQNSVCRYSLFVVYCFVIFFFSYFCPTFVTAVSRFFFTYVFRY